MQAFSQVYDTSRDATLAAFRKRGAKLLIFHRTADPIFSALESIDYYQRLSRNNGGRAATAQWARLFLVPGMNHCAGGPATDSFDGLGAIVELMSSLLAFQGVARAANFAGRTRPLCAYPEYARYSPCSAFGSAALVAQMVPEAQLSVPV